MKNGATSNSQLEELSEKNEGEMRKTSIVLGVILLPAALLAQSQAQVPAAAPQAPKETPAATSSGTGRVAVVDFQKAIVENVEGKKAQEKLMGEVNKRQKEFEEKQKSLSDAQNKLQTQGKVLGAEATADLTRQIEKLNTDLQRMNDDAQKDIGDLQQQLLRPIADRAQKVLQAYSTENGFAVVFDVSNQANNIIYVQDVADITTEIVRRVDSELVKTPVAPAAPAPKPAEPPKTTK